MPNAVRTGTPEHSPPRRAANANPAWRPNGQPLPCNDRGTLATAVLFQHLPNLAGCVSNTRVCFPILVNTRFNTCQNLSVFFQYSPMLVLAFEVL